jgi:L-threonylcarbamoyladenylate synthase
MLRLKVAENPDSIERAADLIREGAVVAIPTDTLYGLAADPFSPAAVRAIFAVKGRAADKAIPLIAADMEQVDAFLGPLSTVARTLGRAFWPGPLTVIILAPSSLPAELTGDGGTVGIRVPNHTTAQRLCARFGRPLTATSANLSGEAPSGDPDLIAQTLGSRLAALLDDGPTPGGSPSTIVDLTYSPARLVRAGAVEWERIEACLRS